MNGKERSRDMKRLGVIIVISILVFSCKKPQSYKCNEIHTDLNSSGFYAETTPDKGNPYLLPYSPLSETAYFDKTPSLSLNYFERIEEINGFGGQSAILIEILPSGAEQLQDLFNRSKNKRVGIIINGKLIFAPMVNSEIHGRALELPFFSEKQRDEIYNAIAPSVYCQNKVID